MSTAIFEPELDAGILANNGMLIRMLQTVLTRAEGNSEQIPQLVERVLDKEAWRAFLTVDGQKFFNRPHEFRRFIESPRPGGLQTTVSSLRKFLRDPKLIARFEVLTVGPPGRPNNPYECAGAPEPEPEINSYNVRVNSDPTDEQPATLPIDEPIQEQQSSSRPQTGNSIGYAYRRIRRAIEEKGRADLVPIYERLLAGEITAHRAMIEAGFSLPSITVLQEPEAAARVLRKHFRGAALRELIAHLGRGDV